MKLHIGIAGWGVPGNWRDPALGIGRSKYQFAAPQPKRSNNPVYGVFLFADGSVQNINSDVDQRLLKELATPASGDDTLKELNALD